VLASEIVWLDCLLMNVDRTVRNTNMLCWHRELWLIDHGASLYFHHAWNTWKEQATRPFVHVKDHVLLSFASELDTVDKKFRQILTKEKIQQIVSLIPNNWLQDESFFSNAQQYRDAYAQFLNDRVENSSIFVKEAQHAREKTI
jgi:hypothetical protein